MPSTAQSSAPPARSSSTPRPSRPSSTWHSCTRPCALSRLHAVRARTRPRLAATSAAAAPSRGSRRARAAPAPAPRGARSGRAAEPCSVRRRAITPSRSIARPAGSRCAARSPCMPSAVPSRSSTPALFSAPATKQAKELLTGWGVGGPRVTTLVLLAESEREAGLSFRNLDRLVVLPGRGRRGRQHHRRRTPARFRGGTAGPGRARQRNLRGR